MHGQQTTRTTPGPRAKATGSSSDVEPGNAAAVAQSAELSGLPYRPQMESAFGRSFADVDVQLGADLGNHHAHALATPNAVQFAEARPSKARVAHELTHVVQFQQHPDRRPSRPESHPDDASEREARAVASTVAGGGVAHVSARPTGRVALDAKEGFNAWTLAGQCHEALYWKAGRKPTDIHTLLGPYHQDLAKLRWVRKDYWSRHEVALEQAYYTCMPSAEYHTAYSALRPALTLAERMEHEWYCQGVRGEGIRRIVEDATNAERTRCADDPVERARFETVVARLGVEMQLAIRLMVYPADQALIAVKARLKAAHGTVWNDANGVYTAILRLTPAQRQDLVEQLDGDELSFLTPTEKDNVRTMCGDGTTTATEQQTLDARMTLATDGGGTDDAGVADLAQQTGALVAEERALHAKQKKSRLTDAESARLTALGHLDPTVLPEGEKKNALLYVARDSKGLIDAKCFLGRLRYDVSLDEWVNYASTMGVEPFEVCKERVLHSKGWFTNGHAAVIKAIDALLASVNKRSPRPASVQRLRFRLWGDPHVAPYLRELYVSDKDALDAVTQEEGTFANHLRKLREHWEGMSVDVPRLLEEILRMSADDRATLAKHAFYTKTIQGNWFVSDALKGVIDGAVKTGRLPTDAAMTWARGGSGDGTDEKTIMLALSTADDAKRDQYRLGYWLSRSKTEAKTPEEIAALTAFDTLEADLKTELGDADLDKALGKALGSPRAKDLKTPASRKMAAEIMFQRQKEQLALGEGAWANYFTSTDNNLRAAHTAFTSRYDQYMADGQISEKELKALGFLDNQVKDAQQDYEGSVSMISDIAGTIAAVAAGVIITIASAGTLGPAAAAMVAAVGGGASKALAAEAFGGKYHELLGGDGAKNFGVGAIEGALAVCSAAMAERATKMVGLSGKALQQSLIRATVKGTETGATVLRQRIAAGVVEGIVDGAVSGAVGEMVMTAMDVEFWHQSVWQAMTAMGAALLRGGAVGLGTGAIFGGVTQGATAMADMRGIKQLDVTEVESLGATASVVYKKSDGGITDITLRVGPNVSVDDIQRHLDVVQSLKRYSPLRQRMRTLLGTADEFDAAKEAHAEILKHKGMIDDRLEAMKADALTDVEIAQLQHEIDTFEAAIARYEVIRAQGKGKAVKGEINSTDAERFGKVTSSEDGVVFDVEGEGLQSFPLRSDLPVREGSYDVKTMSPEALDAVLQERFDQARFEAMKSSSKTADGETPLFFRTISKRELSELLNTGRMAPNGYARGIESMSERATVNQVKKELFKLKLKPKQVKQLITMPPGQERSQLLIDLLGHEKIAELHNTFPPWFSWMSPVKGTSLGPHYAPDSHEFTAVIVDTKQRAYRNHKDTCGEGEWLFGGAIGEDEVGMVLSSEQYEALFGHVKIPRIEGK